MALPTVETLNAADEIGNIPESDRMNVGPKQVAPTPIPGSGQVQIPQLGETSKGFSNDYINAVLGAKPSYDPGHLQMYSGQDVYNPRYSSVLPGEDSEEAFAKEQPWYKKWGNALTKMAATSVGTFYNGMTSIPDTMAAIKNGSLGAEYNTASGNAIDKWLQNLENQFPNYYTRQEQAHPFLSAIPFLEGGAANFWSDKFLKNLGFTIGAIGSAAVQDLAIGAVTEGIGEIPLVANQVGKASLFLNKLFTGSDKVGDLLALGKAAGRTSEQLLSLRDMARAAQAVKISNGIRFATSLYGAASSEAGMEARDGYNTVKKDLTDDYIKEHGYAPIEKDLEEIEKYATSSANTRFGVNMAILTLSDAIQFDNILKPFSAAKQGFRSSLQTELEEGAGKIALKKGSIDEFERVTRKGVGGVWDKVRPFLPAILSEGVYEEGGQYAAQVGTQNYYERKYLYDKGFKKDLYKSDDTGWDARSNVNNIIHSVLNGFANEFGTQEGLENIFLGALTGAFSSGVERFLDRKNIAQHRNTILDLLNKQGVTGTLKNNYDTTVTSTRIAADMKRAAKYGDIFKYKNFQHEQFVEFINSGLKAGRFDVRMQQLDMLKEMSNEEFKKAFGLDKTTENTKTVGEYVDALKEKAATIKKSYDLINNTFKNPYSFKNKARNELQQLENENYSEFENYKGQLLYLTSIIQDANQRGRSIAKSIKDISGFINPSFVKDLTNRESLKQYVKTLRDNVKILEKSLESDVSANKAADRAKLNLLSRKAQQIEDNLANPNHDTHSKLFEDILNFQLNGETEDKDIQVPKDAVQQLMQYGVDLNRLDKYKEDANRHFELLSTKKGFDKFMEDIREFKRKSDEAMKENAKKIPPPSTTGTVTPTPPSPVVPPKVTIKDDKGATTSFDVDKDYIVNTGEEAEPVKVVEQTDEGIVVQKPDGTTVIVPVENFFEGDKLGTELNESQNAETSPNDIPPPETYEPASKRGDSKKDLSYGPMATTDPPYDDRTTPDANFQRRHQNFLFNLGSTNPDIFNQDNKPLLRIIPATYSTQKLLGLPDDWIQDSRNDANESPVRAVYVVDKRSSEVDNKKDRSAIAREVAASQKLPDTIKNMFKQSVDGGIDFIYDQYKSNPDTVDQVPEDILTMVVSYKEGQGIYFVDGRGNTISRLGSKIDPSQVIYTNFSNTSLTYGEGGNTEERYTNKQNLNEKSVIDWWREQRKYLLDKTDLKDWPMHQFTISRGIPNEKSKDTRNSLVSTTIIREQDLDKPVIEILTLGNIAVAGALNNEGEGISAHKSSVNMGDMGKPVFNFGGNMGFLDGRRINEQEAKNIFDLLKQLATRSVHGKSGIFKYLNKVVYMPNAGKGGVSTASSIMIQGANLFLGLSKTPLLMDHANLEANKDKIVDFLQTAFHNINNSELLRIAKNPKANDLQFTELKVENGKVVSGREWKNYNHYLLSDKYPSGSKRADMPLATKIVAPQEGEVPMIQKYSVISGIQMDNRVVKNAQQQPRQAETDNDKLKKLGWNDTQIAGFSANIKTALLKNNMTPEMVRRSKEQAEKEQGTKTVEAPIPETKITSDKTFPVLKSKLRITEHIARKAFEDYNKKGYNSNANGSQIQSFEQIISRGGFSEGELDEHVPGWRNNEIGTNTPEKTVEVVTVGGMQLGFTDVVRDANGYITDITPVGRIEGDTTYPFSNPDTVKALILKSLQASELKQDSTNDRKTDDDLDNLMDDPNRKKGPDDQYRLNTINEKVYTKADLDKEFGEFAKMLPNVSIHRVDNMIISTGGGLAWGVLRNGMVYIYQNAEVGTTYHEAFESVWGHFLSGREQQDIYDEFIEREGKFTTYTGINKDFKSATVKEAKEQIAEEFRDYKIAAKKSPKNRLERFFQAVIDFIKKFIFGDRSVTNNVFKKLNRGYYRGYASLTGRNINEEEYSRPGLEKFSESVIQDTIQGMTVDMFMDLFKENQDIIVQLEESPDIAARTIYTKLLDNLTHYFEENATGYGNTLLDNFAPSWKTATPEGKDILRGQMRSIRNKWAEIKANWDNFVKEHKRYLKVFNVEYTIDDEGNIAFAEDESDNTENQNKNQSQYDRDIFSIDAKNAASPKVKLLIATIADSVWKRATETSIEAATKDETVIRRDQSTLTLPKQAQYAKLFNYMLHNLSGINGMYDMWAKLKTMTTGTARKAIDANVQRIMIRLGFDNGFKGKTSDQAKMILAYEGVMNKQKPSFFRQFVDRTRNTYFKTSVLNSKLNQLKDQWTAGMRSSEAVSVNNGNFTFSPDVIPIQDNIEFLNKIGIDISREDYNKLKGKDVTKFNNAVNKIKGLIQKSAKEEKSIPVMSAREIDFTSRLNDIAEIYISNISGDDSQSQHPNLDNEQTSNFVLGNFLSSQVADANNSDNREEFLNKMDNQFYNDIFHADSVLLGKLFFDEDGKRTDKQIEIGVVEGRESWNGENVSASNLTEAERQVHEINANLNGVFYTLLPADAKTEWSIYVGTYLSANRFFGSDAERRAEITAFARQMYDWLKTEIALAKDYPNRNNIEALNRKLGDRKVGDSLRFFQDILDKGTVDRINKNVIDGDNSLESVLTEPQLRAILIEYTTEKANRALQNLLDWNLIDYDKDETTYKLNGFDKTFLDTHLGDEDRFSEAEVMKLLTFREMNYVMNNIEMHKFFFGDPGQYKDELKRVKSYLSGRESTHVDTIGTDEGYNEWANENLNKTSTNGPQLSPRDPGYHQFKNHFNTFTIYDVEYTSAQLSEIEKAIGKERAEPYDKGNEDDAGGYMMSTAYREMLYKASGRFTNAQEKYFQWALAWERNDKAKDKLYEYTDKELEKADKELLKEDEPEGVYFPILKLVHSGVQYVNGVAIASLDKASWAPIFYHWYKGKTLGKLYNQLQAKGIDYVRMESAHKVGIQKSSSTRLYNEKGEYNQDVIKDVKDEAISLKHIGIQVEQSKKEKGQTEGSQARKVVPSDLKSNGVPVDFLKGKDENEAFNEWNLLTEDQKKASSPIYSKVDRHDEALRKLTDFRTDQTIRRLGIENRGGNWVIKDKKKVSDFILDELERRELPRNLAYGLTIDPQTKDFSQPLEANAQYTKIRSIIYSVMEKTIMRPKVSGGQKTMLSVTGFDTGNRIVKREVNGKPVYTADTLKFYTRGKDGTEACEVMLPFWMSKQLKAMGSGKTKEEIIKYLNTNEEGQKLLRGIGFRIPTQGLNSIDFFVVKDFLPEAMGDVIVLPSEITAKAGSDFDIDKLNTYLRNFYVDNTTGYPRLVQWKGSPEATREWIEKLLDSGNIISAGDKKFLDRYMEEQKDMIGEYDIDEDMISSTPQGKLFLDKMNYLFSDEKITRDFLENRFDVLKDKVYMQALENEYFDSIEEILKLPETYSRLITPNDASQLKEDRTYIKGLIAEREGKTDDNLGNYGKLLDSTFMMQERHAYLMSKGVVGTSAVSQTAHAVSQNLPGGLLVVDPDIVARFPHNKINGHISLSGLTISGSDQYISNVNSQTTDGGVDVAKDKFLAEMGINKDTLGIYLALRRMGSPRRWAELFLNQPAIQDYLKFKAINDNISKVNSQITRLAPYELVNKVLNRYGFDPNSKKETNLLMSGKPTIYTMSDMADMIRFKELNGAQKRMQAWMLDDFLKYNSLGWDLFHFYQGYNYDTARLNDPNEIRLKNLKFLKANNQLPGQISMITPVGKVMSGTFIGAMKRNVERLNSGLKTLINVQIGEAGKVLDDTAFDLFYQGGLTAYDRNKIMMSAETALVDSSIQTGGEVNGKSISSYIRGLTMGPRAIAYYIKAMKEMKDIRIGNNPFIKNLVPLIDKRPDWPSIVILGDRDYDTYTSNVWTDAFRELKDDATIVSINDNRNDDRTVGQIFKNLALLAIIQSGSKKTSTSLSHLVPNETYSEFTKDALKQMKVGDFYENLVLYRTNWNNDKLVPVVKPIWDDEIPDRYYYPLFRGKDAVLTDTLKQLIGSDKPAGLMNVEAWKYKNAKAIKIKETADPVTGDRYAVPLIRVFQRVEVQGIDGNTTLTMRQFPKNMLFKEINVWGDGNNIQEYHNETTQSVLPINRKVNEINNDQLIYALIKAGYRLNVADETVQAALNRVEDSGMDQDEDTGTDSPDNTPPGPVAPVPGQGEEFEPEDNIEECTPGGFSIKNQE